MQPVLQIVANPRQNRIVQRLKTAIVRLLSNVKTQPATRKLPVNRRYLSNHPIEFPKASMIELETVDGPFQLHIFFNKS